MSIAPEERLEHTEAIAYLRRRLEETKVQLTEAKSEIETLTTMVVQLGVSRSEIEAAIAYNKTRKPDEALGGGAGEFKLTPVLIGDKICHIPSLG